MPLINVLRCIRFSWPCRSPGRRISSKPDLYVTAMIALGFKSRHPDGASPHGGAHGIHREIEVAVGTGLTMLVGIGLVACRWISCCA